MVKVFDRLISKRDGSYIVSYHGGQRNVTTTKLPLFSPLGPVAATRCVRPKSTEVEKCFINHTCQSRPKLPKNRQQRHLPKKTGR